VSLFPSLSRPTIIAHRGASAHAPENTLAAFELALQYEADAIELDAKLSADGQVVVIHDQTVDRTTDGSGKLREMTLDQLRKLDAGSHFDIAFRGERIPMLSEVFEAVGKRTFINVELTNYASPIDDLPVKVVELVQQYGLAQRVLFSSFSPLALQRAHRLLPEVPIGLLATRGWFGALARSWLSQVIPYQALHPELHDVTPKLVKRIHRAGRRVCVYTVNQPNDIRYLFALGVDGIFTDDPRLARQTLETMPEDINRRER
jgi:glycerophosphoryl diester phosphodiesterase